MKKLIKNIKKYCKKSGLFSRIIVIFCLAYSVRIVEWAMNEFERSNMEAATLLTVSLALFGGELVLLCMKRIFSKNDGRKGGYNNEDTFINNDNNSVG